jgi:peptidoglycan/LPS O-acetylase OafA/YrhL
VLVVLDVSWLTWSHHNEGSLADSMGLCLPAFFTWFGVGIGLAVISVHLQSRPAGERGSLEIFGHLRDEVGACWLISAACFVTAVSPIAGPRSLVTSTAFEAVAKSFLYAGAAGFFVLPLVLDAVSDHPVRRVMASGSLSWLGRISYGIFLVHMGIIDGIYVSLDRPAFTGPFAGTLALVVALAVLAAWLLNVLVERPVAR